MAAGQVGALPNRFAGFGVEAGGTVTAEVYVNAAGFNSGTGCGVTVDVVAQRFRFVAMKNVFIEQNVPGLSVEADRVKIVAILGGGGDPDLAVEDDRG